MLSIWKKKKFVKSNNLAGVGVGKLRQIVEIRKCSLEITFFRSVFVFNWIVLFKIFVEIGKRSLEITFFRRTRKWGWMYESWTKWLRGRRFYPQWPSKWRIGCKGMKICEKSSFFEMWHLWQEFYLLDLFLRQYQTLPMMMRKRSRRRPPTKSPISQDCQGMGQLETLLHLSKN